MSIRTLIVDDNSMVRFGLSIFLETIEGFEMVGEASNGEEAIAQCAQLQPDLVLMDMLMPVMDGIAATHHIRKQFPHIQVVMLSSATDPAHIQTAFEAGITQFIPKSAGNEHLAQVLGELAVNRPAPETPRLDLVSGAGDDANYFAQLDALLQRRALLYQQLANLQEREMIFSQAVQAGYAHNEHKPTTKAEQSEIISRFRQEHQAIFKQLREIRVEAKNLAVQIKTPRFTRSTNGIVSA